jgi:hypothetical protein
MLVSSRSLTGGKIRDQVGSVIKLQVEEDSVLPPVRGAPPCFERRPTHTTMLLHFLICR